MGVNGVSSNGQVGFDGFSAGGLSSEMLLAYMRGNLEGLDDQITGALSDMNARRQRTGELTDILNRLRELRQEAANCNEEGGGADNDGLRMNEQRADGAWIKNETNHEIRDLLTRAGLSPADVDELVSDWGHHAHADEIETAIQRVSDEVGKLNNLNDYETLRINDLMSKRSQMIQMVSKMMASLDETARSVIQNIG